MPVPRPIPGQIITGAQLNYSTLRSSTTIGAALTAPTISGGITLDGDVAHDNGDLGFFGTTPASQQTALTAQHAALSQAGTDSGDVTIQAAADSGAGSAFGFANAAEFEAVVASVINLMTRVQELEDKLQAYGLLA